MDEPQPAPLTFERFVSLWTHPVSDHQRNWVADFETYRDGFAYLMAVRRPHFARMAVPTYLQAALISAFLDGYTIYVRDCPSGERVWMTIWHPADTRDDPSV